MENYPSVGSKCVWNHYPICKQWPSTTEPHSTGTSTTSLIVKFLLLMWKDIMIINNTSHWWYYESRITKGHILYKAFMVNIFRQSS